MFCTEVRGTASWIEWACCLSEALGASIRATCLVGPTAAEYRGEVERLRIMWYRLVYGTASNDDQVELLVALGLVPAHSPAYERAVALQDRLFPLLILS